TGVRRTEVFAAVPPGEGQTRVVRAPGALAVSAQHGGATVHLPLAPTVVDPAALLAQLEGPPGTAWIASNGPLAAWVETATGPPPLADKTPRGQMDRNVVRNALSLAYMPRARAC